MTDNKRSGRPPSGSANRNLLLRVASALVLAPPLVYVVLADDPRWTAGVIHLAALLALGEFYGMTLAKTTPRWLINVAMAVGLGLSVALYWLPADPHHLAALLIATLLLATLCLASAKDLAAAVASASILGFGLLYVPLLLNCLAQLKTLPHGAGWLLLTLTTTFIGDTTAYAAGRAMGRHKLHPAISPGKTVEGSIGGLIGSLGAGALAKLWYMPVLGWLDVLLLCLPAGLLGQAGDLFESMIKRSCGVKDSGRILPGHGGMLDRIDALLFAAAYVYLYAKYVTL